MFIMFGIEQALHRISTVSNIVIIIIILSYHPLKPNKAYSFPQNSSWKIISLYILPWILLLDNIIFYLSA